MKRIIALILLAALAFSVSLSFVGCGAPEDPGAEIGVYLGDRAFDFDPSDYYVDSNAEQVMSLLFEPLFTVDEDGDLECAAADDYDINEKEREIVITLRETYWSDDVQVKAQDYIYAWRDVILEPNNPNHAAALFYDIENAIEVKNGRASLYEFGAVASDVFEITIKYREGADTEQLLKNLASVATSPLREDVVSKAKTYWSKSIVTIVTNGPFKVKIFDEALGEFELERNLGFHQNSKVEDYDDEVIPYKLISTFRVDDTFVDLTYSDIENKTVFYLGDAPLSDRAANKDKAVTFDDLSTYSYVFNTEKPLFAIKEVRQALSMALDREAIVSALTFGKAATGFLPDTVAKNVYGKNIPNRLTGTLAEAEALLSEVDFKGIDKSFTLTVNDDEESLAIAEIAKAAWESLGFEVKINAVGSVSSKIMDQATAEFVTINDSKIQALAKEASYGKRDFDIIALDWQMYSDDPFVALSAFTSHLNGNGVDFTTGKYRSTVSGWWSSEYDNYMNIAYLAGDDKYAEAGALEMAEKYLIENCPVIPVIYGQSFAFVNEELSDVYADGFGNFVLTEAELDNYKDYIKKED